MATWPDFEAMAPRIATIFRRRHTATGNLCMLGTLRADRWPRLSPMEPRFFEDELLLVGMPGTAKFADDLVADIGLDLRDQVFDQFLAARIVGAAAVEVADDHMDVTTWRTGHDERVLRKH